MITDSKFKIEGLIKIYDPISRQIFFEGTNSCHYENLSVAIVQSLITGPLDSDHPGVIYSMNFGNGGTTVAANGVVTYNPPNVVGSTAQLYNQTYSKVINNNFASDLDTTNNNMTYSHITGKAFSDIIIKCRLDYNEPSDQLAFDNSNDISSTYAFDEFGLFSYGGQLLTHCIHSPILKSLNRLMDISYTLRISTLSSLSA